MLFEIKGIWVDNDRKQNDTAWLPASVWSGIK